MLSCIRLVHSFKQPNRGTARRRLPRTLVATPLKTHSPDRSLAQIPGQAVSPLRRHRLPALTLAPRWTAGRGLVTPDFSFQLSGPPGAAGSGLSDRQATPTDAPARIAGRILSVSPAAMLWACSCSCFGHLCPSLARLRAGAGTSGAL